MIKELQIKNFRNIANKTFVFTNNASILSGKNGLGKSNALNAVNWCITGTILTDKWGTGENDIDSIIPKNATRGITPEVSIITDKGTVFTKKYISLYSRDGAKVKGHTTEFYVNNVSKNETEFKQQLFQVLNFEPSLKTKDVNELRLFTDPLYALQKLDAKQLRALLVDLGCSVTPEELYKKGFEELRPYGEQYLGKWDAMRKALKENVKDLTKDIENLQAKLETVSSIEEFNPAELEVLNNQYEQLLLEKNRVVISNKNPKVEELEEKIKTLEITLREKHFAYQSSLDEKKAMLTSQRRFELDKANEQVHKLIQDKQKEISNTEKELSDIRNDIEKYTSTIQSNNNLMSQYVTLAKKIVEQKNNYSLKLESTRLLEYKGMVTCPICSSTFAPDLEEKAKFELHKRTEIDNLIKELETCEFKKQEYKQEFDKAKELKEQAQQSLEITTNLFVTKGQELATLRNDLIRIQCIPIDRSKVEEIDKELQALEQDDVFFKEQEELDTLRNELNEIKVADTASVQEAVDKIRLQIDDVKEKISEAHIKNAKANEKAEYLEQLDNAQKELNNKESLLSKCQALIQTMISLINQKATERTGLTFVMLEENLTNEGIKEVCYATIEGVPFKDVNTAKKIQVGIKFIEKLKELLGHNDLPILVDRMEGIDNIDKIKVMTNEQLICTRVENKEEIEIC